jgi:putative ABC transport system permease protein
MTQNERQRPSRRSSSIRSMTGICIPIFSNGVSVGGAIRYVRLFTIIGAFVLFLACINFMNLSTARSEKRAKEVGIRKAIGSLRGQLIGQFFSESLFIALLSYIFAIGVVVLLLPLFSEIAGKKMMIPFANPWFWVAGLVLSLSRVSSPAVIPPFIFPRSGR